MRPIPLMILLVGAAPAAHGQDLPLSDQPTVIGSAEYSAVAPALTSGATHALSVGHAADMSLAGMTGAGYAASTAAFEIRGGSATFATPDLAAGGPILASVEPRILRATGDVVAVHGVGFSGATAPTVTFAGLPATNVTVVSDTELSVTTPNLTNAFGNPLGPVPVRVTTSAGVAEVEDAAIASPAYVQTSTARIDDNFTVTHLGQPGGTGIPSWAAEIPGVVVPIPGIGGAIELPLIFLTFGAELIDSTGVSSTTYSIPNNPSLIGVELQFQTIIIDSLAPLEASFTNTVALEIQP
jgi:hypothetical protein